MFIHKGLKYFIGFFISVILILITFYYLDSDVNLKFDSFLNLLLIIVLVGVVVFITYGYEIYRYRRLSKTQIKHISNQVIDPSFKNVELINAYYTEIKALNHTISYQNEIQTKWMHDLKLPLSTLKLYIENRKDDLLFEDYQRLTLIESEFEELIQKRIMFDKIHNQMNDLVVESFNLRLLLIEVIKKFKLHCQLKNLSIDVQFDQPFIITSDFKSIRYCLEQVILNAIKYADIQTTISIYRQDNVLFIVDVGEPISSQDLPFVFNQGYTGRNGKASGLAATGMGLYLVKKQLFHLNHAIDIQSHDRLTEVKIIF